MRTPDEQDKRHGQHQSGPGLGLAHRFGYDRKSGNFRRGFIRSYHIRNPRDLKTLLAGADDVGIDPIDTVQMGVQQGKVTHQVDNSRIAI